MSENKETEVHSLELFDTEELLEFEKAQDDEQSQDNSEKVNEPETDNILAGETEEIEEETEKEQGVNVDEAQVEEEEEENSKENTPQPAATKKTGSSQNRLTELPLAKIKHIIKLDPEVKLVNGEAVFLITVCTELFIKALAKESFGIAAQNRKKTITKSHVDQALTMLPVEL